MVDCSKMNNHSESKVKEDLEADIKAKIDLDHILVTEIGQFGKFQLKVFLLAGIIAIFGGWHSEFVFTAARINTRCVIPECDAPQPEWSPFWLSNAVPATGSGTYDNCQRYGNASAESRLVKSDTCPSTLFDRNTLQPCEEYVYENTNSVAYDFGLACDEWRRSLIGTIRTLGTFIVLPITGFISDRWGRRVALSFNAFNTAWIGVTRYWANTYIGFMMSEFVEACLGAGSFSCLYILLLELTGPRYRVAAGAYISSCFAIGQVLLGLIAWGLPDWRHLTLALYIPQLLTISYFWIMTESVRWYMSKGRFSESEALLKNVAKMNGKQLSDKSLQALRETAEDEARLKALEKNGDEPWLVVQVFRHKPILLRCVVTPVWWITTTFVYYGLSINAVNLSGNIYLNYVAVCAVEIPGFWTAVFLMDKIGRKAVLIGAYWMCAACQIAYIFLPQDMFALSLAVYLIAKYAIAIVVAAVYVYTTELYPTKYRHSLFAFSSMIGRIGSMTAPLTPAIGAQWFEELPFVLYGCFAFVSGILTFVTPETMGIKLPDTLEEASQIGRKRDKKGKQ